MSTNNLKNLISNLQELAHTVEEKWKALSFDLNIFPELCFEALTSHHLEQVPDLNSILNDLPFTKLPLQTFPNGEFSDFPITLIRTDKLLIDIYFWYKSDTTIHNHHFCGAFKVIAGESYQINYTFEKTKTISANLDEGNLVQSSNEHLQTQSVHTIKLRDQFIHHVFHLGKPTITLCLRTPFLPGEALASFIYPKYRVLLTPMTPNQSKWLQLLKLQLNQNPDSRPDIPWGDEEVIHMLYLSANHQVSMEPVVASYLLDHIQKKCFLPDFFQLLGNQPTLNMKLKKFGFITDPKRSLW